MFEESLVESSGLLRPRNHRSIAFSVAIQAAIAAVLLSVPLMHPELLPLHAPALSLIAPMPKPPQPPPAPHERLHVESSSVAALPATSAPAPSAPRIPHTQPAAGGSDAPTVDSGLNIGGTGAPGFPMALGSGPVATGPRVIAASSGSGARTRISSGVSAGLLLAPIRAVYPSIAKAAHIEGTVMVQAIISKRGTVESARAMSGPAMLQAAALEAVTKARYRPYLLNGEPTEVDTMFTVAFHLGGS